ncbi:MAG: hypothetical protein ACKN9V_00195 [Pseudomonadota bacterium]
MKNLWITVVGCLLSLTSLLASPDSLGQGLSGNYKLAYIESNLLTRYRGDEERRPEVKSFDFKKVAKPPIPAPIYMLHDPKGPAATLMGGGSDAPRMCEGKSELFSQHLECTPLSKDVWVDETTHCGLRKVFIEEITWGIQDGLHYQRTEAIVFDKDTPKECDEYKKNLLAELKADKAPDFFKAMQKAGLFKDENDFADVFMLTHVYEANETTESAIEIPEGNQTGAYELEYSGKSKTLSWDGDKKENLVESKPFDAALQSIQPERLDNILFFHDSKARSAKISGAGQNKMRKCELVSEINSPTEIYSCTIFKANEEEVGTGCMIEHWVKEEIKITKDSLPRYERIEQRHLSPSTQEGCQQYKNKVSEELKDGSAELFFRVISNTEGMKSNQKMGDTFQLVHEYRTKPGR